VITLDDIHRAAGVVYDVASRTPVFGSRHLGARCGGDVHLKAENLQRTGSFKIRGAYHRISALSADERARGVVAASAGNHAQGVALAARLVGVPATICMPADASIAKVEATRGYGAAIELGGETYHEAAMAARELTERTGATFVSAFDDELVIAGQGTVGLELDEQVVDLDVAIVPCGGGGLLSGIAIALRALRPEVRIIGVQAAGCSPMVDSVRAGEIQPAARVETIADGIAVKRPGQLTFGAASGGTPHMAGELFKLAAKVDLLFVPYKGEGPAIADALGGQISMVFSNLPVGMPQAQSGRLRALAVTSKQRVATAPDVPTVAESGLPGYEASTWFGLFAPSATPREIVAKLNAESVAALNGADVKERMAGQGLFVVANSTEQFAEFLKMEIPKWAKIVKEAGVKPQ